MDEDDIDEHSPEQNGDEVLDVASYAFEKEEGEDNDVILSMSNFSLCYHPKMNINEYLSPY